jgi:hypothetical protein
MSKEIRRIYPIRTSRSKWFIRLFSKHECETHNSVCYKRNQIDDTIVNLSEFDPDNPRGFNGKLLNENNIVIPDKKINIIFDYPLLNSTSINVSTKNEKGFFLKDLIKIIKDLYEEIYEEEAKTASEKTYQLEKLCLDCVFNQSSLESYVSVNKNKSTEECPICYNDFNEDSKVGVLRCGHTFHHKCISEWISYDGKNCPLCRTKIKECKDCNGSLIINYLYTGKVIPVDQRGLILNRNLTDGKYGIYGCDFDDLYLSGLWYDKKNRNLRIFVNNKI